MVERVLREYLGGVNITCAVMRLYITSEYISSMPARSVLICVCGTVGCGSIATIIAMCWLCVRNSMYNTYQALVLALFVPVGQQSFGNALGHC